MFRNATLLLVLSSCFSLTACAESAEVSWPKDWRVDEMPAPDSPFEPGVKGERQRASKLKPDGEQAVVAELTRLPLPTQQEVVLDRVLSQMRQGVQLGFAQSGLQTRCEPPKDARMGNLAAREVTCTASQAGRPALQQSLLMARSETAVYSLTFAMPADQVEIVADEVKQVQASLRLE
ncbi:DUF4946 domain-containing protein [Pseudomonas matsuisoli]|uniref:DUF4946 domain-containing protein n=1 Tax=Pseudomonas matsuisoli TaxID=1515666 RepID=A0A917PVA4_9PSED|nr:DUF4946 domain-containing protein [Pseudomonas matsuisoli]GGJ93412.1 hypothetical protein GCM10009304_19190 [Pseudomonas matsuisoli]